MPALEMPAPVGVSASPFGGKPHPGLRQRRPAGGIERGVAVAVEGNPGPRNLGPLGGQCLVPGLREISEKRPLPLGAEFSTHEMPSVTPPARASVPPK